MRKNAVIVLRCCPEAERGNSGGLLSRALIAHIYKSPDAT